MNTRTLAKKLDKKKLKGKNIHLLRLRLKCHIDQKKVKFTYVKHSYRFGLQNNKKSFFAEFTSYFWQIQKATLPLVCRCEVSPLKVKQLKKNNWGTLPPLCIWGLCYMCMFHPPIFYCLITAMMPSQSNRAALLWSFSMRSEFNLISRRSSITVWYRSYCIANPTDAGAAQLYTYSFHFPLPQGRIVRKPINADPGLKVHQSINLV